MGFMELDTEGCLLCGNDMNKCTCKFNVYEGDEKVAEKEKGVNAYDFDEDEHINIKTELECIINQLSDLLEKL